MNEAIGCVKNIPTMSEFLLTEYNRSMRISKFDWVWLGISELLHSGNVDNVPYCFISNSNLWGVRKGLELSFCKWNSLFTCYISFSYVYRKCSRCPSHRSVRCGSIFNLTKLRKTPMRDIFRYLWHWASGIDHRTIFRLGKYPSKRLQWLFPICQNNRHA